MIRLAAFLLCAGTGTVLAASLVGPDAAPTATFRNGAHQGFGRAVLDVPTGAIAIATQTGDRLVVRLTPSMRIEAGAALPPNVRAMAGGDGVAELTLAPGASVRTMRIGDHFVIDVRDAAPAQKPAPLPAKLTAKPAVPSPVAPPPGPPAAAAKLELPAAAPLAAASPAVDPVVSSDHSAAPPGPAMSPQPSPEASAQLEPKPVPSPPTPLAQQSALALRAEPALGPNGAPAIAVPFAQTTGAAAFRRGPNALLVFDERAPIDLSALAADPVFGSATIQLLPEATLLRLPLAEGKRLSLTRDAGHWIVETSAGAAQNAPGIPQSVAPVADGRLSLPMPGASRVVAVADPLTGGTILVGTVRATVADGGAPAIGAARRLPGLVLPATWQGLVVEPLSDRIAVHAVRDTFIVSADPGGLDQSTPAPTAALLSDASELSRSFDFPALASGPLHQLMQVRIAEAAAAPPLSRAKRRREAAEAMLALGLGAEAEGLLRLTVTEDPRAAADPAIADLDAVASLLAGRIETTGALGVPRASETSERQFWRAAREATLHEGSPEAAKTFAATAPLLRAYPATLRDRMLPLAAETMALGGEPKAAAALMASYPDSRALDFGRALALEAEGKGDAALTSFDALATSNDRLIRVRAIRRATDLRLAAGAIDAAAAAKKLDPLIAAWQGDARELEMRLRVAALQSASGQPRAAIASLRASAKLWPDEASVPQSMRAVLAGVLRDDGPQPLPPLEFAALVEDNADLLPSGGDALAVRLADKLAALDLTHRAGPMIERVMRASPPGPGRAELGARLAAWHVADADFAGAREALAESEVDPDPATIELRSRRSLLAARALAGVGDPAAATTLLALLDGDEALSLRADIAERAHLWPAATEALATLAGRGVPATGPLSEAQARIVLRLAAAAAQAGNVPALADARARGKGKMGKLDDMLRLITAEPVRATADLPRAARETSLARTVASALTATQAAH